MDELKHHSRVIDMLLTMHSSLRDQYSRRALILDVLLLIFSAVLAATIWIDPDLPGLLGISKDSAGLVLGAASLIIFIISLVHLRLDWKGAAERHQLAAAALSRLKLQIRPLLRSESEIDPSQIEGQNRECAAVLASVPPIPEHQFNRLKAAHKGKIELSKAVDSYPNLPLWVIRAKLFLGQMRKPIHLSETEENS